MERKSDNTPRVKTWTLDSMEVNLTKQTQFENSKSLKVKNRETH